MRTVLSVLVVLIAAQAHAAAPAEKKPRLPFTFGEQDAAFSERPPHSADEEVLARLGVRENIETVRKKGGLPAYDIANEKFRVHVPQGYTHDESWGLLVWINPGDDPGIPAAWAPLLAQHKLLAVAAYKSGNPRAVVDRVRLAVDANYNMQLRYNIDPTRVVVAGFSGGGRVASMLAVSYAELFPNLIAVCGVNFYENVPSGDGKLWPRSYQPPAEALKLAKTKGRFVLLTGSKDFNQSVTKQTYEKGFRAQKFAKVLYLEVPGMAHSVPNAEWAGKAFEFLDKPSE